MGLFNWLFPPRKVETDPFLEQRKLCRVSQALPVISPALPENGATTVDVSAGGLKLLTSAPLEPGLRLQLKLDVGVFPIKLQGEVRWCNPLPGGRYHIGVCLGRSAAHTLKAMENFVQQG